MKKYFPINKKRGIGARVKEVNDAKEFLVNCNRPVSPPRNKYAPTILTPKNANATGNPMAISNNIQPISRIRASCHSISKTHQLNYLLHHYYLLNFF